ncbi:COG1361 S-layer family protein [archaeon]|nr:COG1361 S-layer family protein [archaeon]
MKKILILLIILLMPLTVYGYEIDQEFHNEISSGASLRIESLSYNPYPVTPGDFFESWVLVVNRGRTEATDVIVKLIDEYPFSIYPSEDPVKKFSSIPIGGRVLVKFKVKVASDANEAEHKLKIQAQGKDGYLPSIHEIPIDVQTRDSRLAISSVTTEPEKIQAGKPSELQITFTNPSNSIMRDITVKLDLTNVPISPIKTTTYQKIQRLDGLDSSILTFNIIADSDADSKAYKIPVDITFYDDKDTLITRNDTIGILVDGNPQYQLDMEETEVYTKGSSGKVIISISNIGPADMKFVSLKLLSSKDYKIIGTPRVYLGNLDPDDFETAEFLVQSKKSKMIPIKVQIDYKDAYNEEFSEIEAVNLPMYSTGAAVAYGLTQPKSGLFNIIFYIIIILFVYSWYKEWRTQKDIGKSLKTVLKRWIKKIIRFFQPKNLKQLPKRFKNFFKEK